MFSVFSSVCELVFDVDTHDNQNLILLRYLRIFLVLRILKLCVKLEYMSYILNVLKTSLYDFMAIFGLFFLFLSFYALIGRNLLRSYYLPRSTFISFGEAFVTLFRLTTLENWYTTLTQGVYDFNSLILISAFVVSIIFLGNFVFFNLFLTVILDKFELEKEKLQLEIEKIDKSPKSNNMLESKRLSSFRMSVVSLNEFSMSSTMNFIPSVAKTAIPSLVSFYFFNRDFSKKYCVKFRDSPFCKKMCSSFILLHMICTILDSYQFQYNFPLTVLHFFIYCFFFIEAICKIIASGLIFQKNSYLRSYANIINIIALHGFFLNIFYTGDNKTFILFFSIFQHVVPLRILESSKSLNKIVLSIWHSLEEIGNVIIALFVVWFEFFFNILAKIF